MAEVKRHYVRCKVTGNALAIANNEKKTPSVKICLQAIPGANEQIEGYADDRILWADLWLSDNAIDASIETLEKALGWNGMSFQDLNEPILVGREVSCACSWEERNGKWYENVDFINSANSGGVKKLEEAQARDVVSKVDAILARARQNSPTAGGTSGAVRTQSRAAAPRHGASAARTGDPGPSDPGARSRSLDEENFFA